MQKAAAGMMKMISVPTEAMELLMTGDISEALKQKLKKSPHGRMKMDVNYTMYIAVVADPEDPKQEAFAIIVRENK